MTTTPTISNVPQEQLDEEAARQYVLLGGSYRRVAKVIHCDPATAFRRAMRWAKSERKKYEDNQTQQTENAMGGQDHSVL